MSEDQKKQGIVLEKIRKEKEAFRAIKKKQRDNNGSQIDIFDQYFERHQEKESLKSRLVQLQTSPRGGALTSE